MDECGRQRRIQKCRQCGGIGHNKRSCTNRPRNGNGCISSTEQTNNMLQATHENNSEVVTFDSLLIKWMAIVA
ncbi:hypothetical protein JHK87_040179 [Glycine soja]|nr:hypothetical protein JHK87_040179 [Glycine soja]